MCWLRYLLCLIDNDMRAWYIWSWFGIGEVSVWARRSDIDGVLLHCAMVSRLISQNASREKNIVPSNAIVSVCNNNVVLSEELSVMIVYVCTT